MLREPLRSGVLVPSALLGGFRFLRSLCVSGYRLVRERVSKFHVSWQAGLGVCLAFGRC